LVAISSSTSLFVTSWAGLIAVGAILTLLLLDRLKPSRASRVAARARRRGQPVGDVVVLSGLS
jgi:hypothetical protein